MRITGSIVAATGMLATALTFAGAPQAEAARACNKLGLNSPCVNSSDIRANVVLGGSGEDGRLRLRNEAGATAV